MNTLCVVESRGSFLSIAFDHAKRMAQNSKRMLLAAFFSIHLASMTYADLIVTSASRGVLAAATGPAGPIDDFDSTVLTGLYSHDVTVTGVGPAGTISSSASQSSFIPGFTGPSMSGTGSASVSAMATGMMGFSNAAVSMLDVNFEVTSSGMYALDAEVLWSGTAPPYGGYSKVEILNTTASTTVALVESDPGSPGMHSLHSSYFLAAGVDYKLNVWVDISGGGGLPGSYSASGSWDVTLSTIPEPGSLLICTFGFILSGMFRRAQRP